MCTVRWAWDRETANFLARILYGVPLSAGATAQLSKSKTLAAATCCLPSCYRYCGLDKMIVPCELLVCNHKDVSAR